ncbi:(12E)-labda-8(17),12,14-triene synthase [Streptomyces chartreusis]|uniref:terpene synthase family protein n=1 Tax=Streptomyces chartreusis TaxID=1969 RepID=UPI0038018262
MSGTHHAAAIPPQPDFTATFPGPHPASPHSRRTERELLSWLEEYPLLPHAKPRSILVNITSHGASRTFPTAAPDDLALFAKLLLWLTAFDDEHGEANAAANPAALVNHSGELMFVLTGVTPSSTANPFPGALHDLLARFRARTSPAKYLGLAASLRDTITALVWEAHHAAEPDGVALATYLAMRPHTVFVRTIIAAAEIVLDYELADSQRGLASVRCLESSVANLAGWINDLASYQREASRGPVQPLSLPTLLQARYHWELEQVFTHISGMCEDEADTARQRITELACAAPSALSAHARALENIARSFIWHTSHARYH